MAILVADTSVLIDLERSGLVECAFGGEYEFAVPDLLFDRELKGPFGSALLKFGLEVVELDAAETEAAQQIRIKHLAVSVPDAFAYSLAVSRRWPLLAGDGALRRLAADAKLECYGVLWLMDQMLIEKMATTIQLHTGLTQLSKHVRCRLPIREIQLRLEKYSRGDEA